MSRAKKCDICGTVYEEYPVEKNLRIETYERQSTGTIGVNEMDCCPKCSKDILMFIDVIKTYPDRWCVTIPDET